MQIKQNRIIFITGFPRSGTTLMQALLDNHPQLLVFPEETKYFKNFLRAKMYNKKYSKEEKIDLLFHNTLSRLRESRVSSDGSRNRDYSSFNYKMFKDIFLDSIKNTESDKKIFTSIFTSYKAVIAPEKRNLYFVVKNPQNFQFFPLIKKWFGKNLSVIHMERDVYDVYYSNKKARCPNITTDKFAYQYLFMERMYKWGKKHIPQFYTVHYEKLVKNPKEIMRDIADFLKIDFNGTLLQPTFMGTPWKGNSSFAHFQATIHTASLGLSDSLSNEQKNDIHKSLNAVSNKFKAFKTFIRFYSKQKLM